MCSFKIRNAGMRGVSISGTNVISSRDTAPTNPPKSKAALQRQLVKMKQQVSIMFAFSCLAIEVLTCNPCRYLTKPVLLRLGQQKPTKTFDLLLEMLSGKERLWVAFHSMNFAYAATNVVCEETRYCTYFFCNTLTY